MERQERKGEGQDGMRKRDKRKERGEEKIHPLKKKRARELLSGKC